MRWSTWETHLHVDAPFFFIEPEGSQCALHAQRLEFIDDLQSNYKLVFMWAVPTRVRVICGGIDQNAMWETSFPP